MKLLFYSLALVAALAFRGSATGSGQSQPASPPQPLNTSVSDYGTTFIFSPPPICSKCIETELGFQAAGSTSQYIPGVVSIAPFKTNTDISVLVNLLDSESADGDRATQFGNRFDFVVRQQVLQKGGLLVTLAPRGAVFVRGGSAGRAGATAAPQFSKGNNLCAANFSWTGAIGTTPANPKSDYQGYFDYFRTLNKRGAAVFLGFAHEFTAGLQTVGTEEGGVIPFRNGQIELEAAQLDLNTSPAWQFQTRVIVNWGKVLAHR